jgi:hypothetical protein
MVDVILFPLGHSPRTVGSDPTPTTNKLGAASSFGLAASTSGFDGSSVLRVRRRPQDCRQDAVLLRQAAVSGLIQAKLT